MAKKTTTAEPTLPWAERQRARANAGLSFYPKVTGEMTRRDWEMTFDAHEGALHPSKLPERLRALYDRPWPRILQEALYSDGMIVPPPGDDEVCRLFWSDVSRGRTGAAVSGGNVAAAAFANRVNTWVLDGYAEGQDSLDGIVAEDELTNYLPAPIIQSLDTHSLKPVPKGGTAEDTQLAVEAFGDWRLTRFARKATIDEQDMVNDVPGSLRKNLAALGRAAKRAWLDWAWATILSNPVLDLDGVALFDAATHKNLVTGAITDFSATLPTANPGPMAAAFAQMRRQVVATNDGSGQIQHINLEPAFVICTPDLEWDMHRLFFPMIQSGCMVEIRVESRLTDIGVRNPLTGEVVTGSRGNWLLSADSTVAPWLLRGVLQGNNGPKIRMSELTAKDAPGQYGLGVDVSQALACKVCDFRGVVGSITTA